MKGKPSRRTKAIAGAILLLFGVFFLGAVLWNPGRLIAFGAGADGVVTEVEEIRRRASTSRRDGESRAAYRERKERVSIRYLVSVRFTPASGPETTFRTSSTFGHVLSAGDAVRIRYLAADPATAEIDTTRQVWLPFATGLTVAAVCLGLGGWLVRRAALTT
jgi:hypothetical protein